MLRKEVGMISIAKIMGVSRTTARHFIKTRFNELKRFRVNRLTFGFEVCVEKKEFDLPALIRSTVAFIPQERLTMHGTCQPYYGNEELLTRVFENIALNAKYEIRGEGKLSVNMMMGVDYPPTSDTILGI